MVDFVNRLLYPADSMDCLFADYDQAAGRSSLLMGSRRFVAGNPYDLAAGHGGLQVRRRHDAICRYLADPLGQTTGKKIEWAVSFSTPVLPRGVSKDF